MIFKNNYTTAIGFGAVHVLPGETANLPRGYDEDNPLIQFYLGKKWIEIVGANNVQPAAKTIEIEIETGGNGGKSDENGGGEEQMNDTAVTVSKPLSRMAIEDLRILASELGIEIAETDKRQALIDKIRAAREGGK